VKFRAGGVGENEPEKRFYGEITAFGKVAQGL
jgi:hypothetical protein